MGEMTVVEASPESNCAGSIEVLPLAGIKVLDFSQFLAGPSCALRLADLGARVIKVERRDGGDACRQLLLAGREFDGDSALFHTINRNKQSYAADLKDRADLRQVTRLVADADVLIHNFRPGVMERLGLGYDAIADLNPAIIYAGVTGYGAEGPWRDKPGQDLLVQSLSGITWLTGDRDTAPVPTGLSITDMMAGAQLAQGVLALLVRRGLTGRGGRVDVSLMETAVDLQFENLTAYLNGAPEPERSAVAGANVYLGAPYGIYATSDSYIALAMMPVDKLARLIGSDALLAYPPEQWFAERDAIKRILGDHLVKRTTQEWLDVIEPAGLWCAPVLRWAELMDHPGFHALRATQSIRTPEGATMKTTRCPIRIDGEILVAPAAAPRLGADNVVIDAELRETEE